MDKEVSELVVLQLIHTLISNKNEELVRNGGGINMIGNNLRISLVKLTNEIQNNLLINELTNLRRQSNVANGNRKLGINDILTIVKNLFPEYRTTLNDGQLSLHGLEMHDIEKLLDEKYDRFKKTQVEQIRMMEDEILKNGIKTGASQLQPHANAGKSGSAGTSATVTTTTPHMAHSMDPKREKLLKLYRDTVLNKLESKTGNFQKLFKSPDGSIIKNEINYEDIKNETPGSVHELQLILQKSITDGVMRKVIGTDDWKLARQVQFELDDTVQFMRRALE
ncbi:Eaf5p [Saccharomyces cerevisiae]|nr:Eaf5p [Saccharomyces cerevisiae]CAI4415646.1 BDN_1c_G0014320.mRNA.1.CDS.1 [Saccharomyces cerevisiae]CAI4417882.1 ACA_G0014560.mRNA.1.CDS.1 [Saccharomyces cerevisiae]CAI6622502.1 ACA_G0014560.mRNA.1.CDS.1 [Saccharomyces cerevisiae]CAI7099532.1 BDN_1c_G0014320.mRNA.1.CDS.1 [Saccharomyces cerevisiae]